MRPDLWRFDDLRLSVHVVRIDQLDGSPQRLLLELLIRPTIALYDLSLPTERLSLGQSTKLKRMKSSWTNSPKLAI